MTIISVMTRMTSQKKSKIDRNEMKDCSLSYSKDH